MNEDRRLRYQRAKPIAMAALELAVAERASYVAGRCGGDGALYDEACWMLEAAEATVPCNGLRSPLLACDMLGSTVSAAGSSGYRILRQLGEGGGGVVYLAERALGEGTPDELRQQVAIKVLHAIGPAGDEAQRRFVEERRILASLNHPNIAHLIDGGSTRDGRPFLALEYVEGERIDRWCERHGLSLRERVRLFLKVCAAVHFAHQHLVIHRDLKPGNILVNEAGEPKLLDFGIARLLDRVGGVAATRTQTDMRKLTLAYASPEQLRGGALGTGVDVWSLGVLLYQLVCGERPFDDEEVSPQRLTAAIDTGRLLPPSRRQRTAKLRADVPADIDAIVMKALRRDPADRYTGVDALAHDLRQFLAARPVRARQGAAWYHARLYLRRHAMAVGVAAILLVVLLAYAAQRAQQVQRLELERDKTAAIAGFLQNLFENADPTHAHGSNLTVREVLDRGAATLGQRKDIAAPVRVSLLLSMGRAYNQLGLGERAVGLLEDARQLQAGYAASALERGEVLAALGRAYSTAINLAQARTFDHDAITLLRQAPGDHALAILRVRINLLYNELGASGSNPATIERETQQVLGELAARRPPEPELQLQATAVLAMAQGGQGRDAVAMATAQQAWSDAQRLYADDDPARIYYRFVLALVSMRHDPHTAVALFRDCVAAYDHQVGAAGSSMAGMLTYFGVALGQMGDLPDARAALERSARLVQPLAEVSPDFQLYTLTELARVYMASGQGVAAERVLEPQLARLNARKGSDWGAQNHATALLVLGDAALARGDTRAAVRNFAAVQRELGQAGAMALPDAWGQALAGQGEAALREGQPGQAERWLVQLTAFNQASKAAPDDPRRRAADQLQAALRRARRVAAAPPPPACAAAAVDSDAPSCQDAPLVAALRVADTRDAAH